MSKSSRYLYQEFYFYLIDANGYECEPFGEFGNYEVSIDAMNYEYQVFTIHSAVKELTKFVKRHGNFTMGKDFFIKKFNVSVFDNQECVETDLPNERIEELKNLISPKLIWVSHSKVAKRIKCEDAPCCGCCDISDDGWNGYLN